MSLRPRVTRLVMFKHGVAYVERSGPVDGDFDLPFRHDDMNDVLKSLSVGVAGEATVSAIGFDTPTDPDDDLRARNLEWGPGEALPGLLEAVRGRLVEVSGPDQQHRGEVLGIDEVDGGDGPPRRLLVLRADPGGVVLVDLDTAERLELLEQPSRDDLDYMVDRSRAATAGQNRAVSVHVSGPAKDVRVSYVVPAPVWRVSYRLIRDGENVVLSALGIVHNPLDEALEDVALTLTTGQPISFDIDLYRGKRVRRTVIEEQSRAAGPPTAYPVAPAATLLGDGYSTGEAELDFIAAAVDVETGDRGEHFEYALSQPISLKRGGSAMVPLVNAPLDDARKERIWRDGSPPAPDIVLIATNSTGVVLEEGPAVIYDEGSYAGESMLPFTARGAGLTLGFAKDLAVRCGRTSTISAVTTRVQLAVEAAIEEQRLEKRHTLRAENDHDEAVDVIVELLRAAGHTFESEDGGATPLEDTVSHHRFRVAVPGHGKAEAVVRESSLIYRDVAYDQLSPDRLESWLATKSLDEKTVKALTGVLKHSENAKRADAQRGRLDAERSDIDGGQTRITEQLKVLGHGGPEAELRRRHVFELESLQKRAAQLDGEIRRLRDVGHDARRAAGVELQRVIAAGEEHQTEVGVRLDKPAPPPGD